MGLIRAPNFIPFLPAVKEKARGSNLGGVKPSYLGPPESFFEVPNSKHQAPEKHQVSNPN
jgi:hypothetical protein